MPAIEAAPPVRSDARSRAIVAGATGLVGGHLLPMLCRAPEYGRVLAVSRRPLIYDHPKLANRIVRFEELEQSLAGMHAEEAFCCLGTTLRAAGSREAFRSVDHDHVLAFARAALRAGAQRLVLVSSVGADASSPNFYLRVKGEMEAEVAELGFAALDILQPSLLTGWRRELRPVELAAMLVLPLVNPLLLGGAERFRAVSAETVAAAMVGAMRGARKGLHRHTHRGIRDLAALAKRPARTSAPARA